MKPSEFWDDDRTEREFEESGNYNCPYRFGVDYAAAIIDGKVNCKHFKQKDEGE